MYAVRCLNSPGKDFVVLPVHSTVRATCFLQVSSSSYVAIHAVILHLCARMAGKMRLLGAGVSRDYVPGRA